MAPGIIGPFAPETPDEGTSCPIRGRPEEHERRPGVRQGGGEFTTGVSPWRSDEETRLGYRAFRGRRGEASKVSIGDGAPPCFPPPAPRGGGGSGALPEGSSLS